MNVILLWVNEKISRAWNLLQAGLEGRQAVTWMKRHGEELRKEGAHVKAKVSKAVTWNGTCVLYLWLKISLWKTNESGSFSSLG